MPCKVIVVPCPFVYMCFLIFWPDLLHPETEGTVKRGHILVLPTMAQGAAVEVQLEV